MPRRLIDDLRAGQLMAWTVVRGKCSYGDRHESVRLVGDVWHGEDSRDTACPYAPPDPCPVCATSGVVVLTPDEAAMFDGTPQVGPRTKPCVPCGGSGFVPGPHWPWRHPHPGPLPVKEDR